MKTGGRRKEEYGRRWWKKTEDNGLKKNRGEFSEEVNKPIS